MHTVFKTGTLALALVATAVATPQMQSQIVTLKATLTGADENPIIQTGAHGDATVVIDRGAGTIKYEVNIYNLPSGVTASHIHVSPKGINGPIVFDFVVPPQVSGDFQLSGTVSSSALQPRPAQGILTFEDAIFSIASGVAYVNVHTQINPGGEIRGQLCPTSASANVFNRIAACTAPD
jgi:hypothetical protein